MFTNNNLGNTLSAQPAALANAFLNSPLPIALFDGADFKIVFVNDALLELWNKDRNIVGSSLSEIFPEVENEALIKTLKQAFRSGIKSSVDDVIVHINTGYLTKEVYCEHIFTALADESGTTAGALLMVKDVTEHFLLKKASGTVGYNANLSKAKQSIDHQSQTLLNVNSDLETQQAILASIVNSSDDTILSKTLDGIIISWNGAAERMFGYTADEIIGKHISLIIPPSRLQEEEIILSNILKGKKIDNFETIRVAKDGRQIPVSLSISPVQDKNGNIIGASKIARDITEIVKSQERKAILAAIVNTSDDTIISKSLEGIITSWNLSAQKMFGYTEQEVIGKHISILIPHSRLYEEEIILSNIVKGNKVDHFETVRLAKNGKEVHVSVSVSPVKDNRGNIIGASKIARDIGTQKLAKESMKRYARNLEIIYSMGKSISGELNLNNILQKVVDETTSLTGAKFGAFFYNAVNENGEDITLFAISGVSADKAEQLATLKDSPVFLPTFNGETKLISDLNTEFTISEQELAELNLVSFLSVPVISKSGDVIGGLFFGHPEVDKFTNEHEDLVTAIASQASIGLDNAKLYEEVKLLNSKKDEFIGLASHELKTPLTSISGYLQILERTLSEDKNKKFVNKTILQVNKLTSLVSDLLDVSKIEAGKLQLAKEMFDIRFVLNEAIELIDHSNVSATITLDTEIDSLPVYGDPQRIEQVVINFLTNAIKYSPSNSEVKVSLISTDNEVLVGVKDSGIGISEEMRSKVFSRFYRVEGLSPHMSGLGIGLYLSKEIIERHDGKIWVESELDKGSTFWFSLPLLSTFN